MDERDWNKKYDVLAISRVELRLYGLTTEQINQLSDEDMIRLAEELYHRYVLDDFADDVLFVVKLILAEQHEGDST